MFILRIKQRSIEADEKNQSQNNAKKGHARSEKLMLDINVRSCGSMNNASFQKSRHFNVEKIKKIVRGIGGRGEA